MSSATYNQYTREPGTICNSYYLFPITNDLNLESNI